MTGPVRGAHRFRRLEQAPVLGETVVGLGTGRLGVPLVPDRWRVVLWHLCPAPGVLQASLHQHGTRAEVRQDFGNGPVAGVGLRLELVEVETPPPARGVDRQRYGGEAAGRASPPGLAVGGRRRRGGARGDSIHAAGCGI